MNRFLSPQGLTRTSARHPWLVLGAWVLLIAGAVFAAMQMDITENSDITGTDSYRADKLLEERLRGDDPASETIVVESSQFRVDDPAYRDFVTSLTADLRNTEGVASVTNAYEAGEDGLVSADRTMTLIVANLTGDAIDADETVVPLLDTLENHQAEGFEVLTAGDGSINRELNERFEQDIASAEQLGVPAALVVLFFVFGAAVAAGVPVVLGFLGIALSIGITALLSHVLGVGSIVTNMITMIGLAVGIDYSLFIIERFREERGKGATKLDAITTAGNTASRAVVFSGMTVVIALAGLMIVPASDFKGMSIGAITAVVAAVLVALTLLPALLSLLDGKINWLHLPGRAKPREDQSKGFFAHTTDAVIRHPIISVAGATALLLAMAAPIAAINLGNPGLTDFPQDLESVRAFNIINDQFSAGRLE
ncbi:MAG: MMPL family transporter, partial [Hyphomicrobiales bacterium]